MIDTSKQYTYNGKPVRIYADGSDTAGEYIHGAFSNEDGSWALATFSESDLVETWLPKEGDLCFFWDNGSRETLIVRKFLLLSIHTQQYIDSNDRLWDNCAKFSGTLPEAFKGLM